ncbi:MAG: restriction endonuclease subunit S [Akkermansia sp.]
MSMARQMKDSGVEWIGEIPVEWETIRCKYLASVLAGFPFDSSKFSNSGGTPLIRIRDITAGYSQTRYTGEYDSAYIVRKGDLLIGMDGDFNIRIWQGENALLNQRCCKVISNSDSELSFLYYCLPFYLEITNSLAFATTVKHLSNSDVLNATIPYPQESTKVSIISVLDTKCAEIDKVVEQTRTTIEEYKKLKQAIITEAVTKGVRGPRPMKPSGVEWIGDIPEEWRVGRIKDFAQLQTGSTPSTSCPHYFNGDIPWFTPGDFSESFEVNKSQRTLSKKVEDEKQAVILPPQTPLIVGIGASAGKVSFSQVKCSCNQQVTALVDCSANRKLLTYILEAGRLYLRDTAAFTTLPIINNQTLGYFKIAVPVCNTEQQEIVAYLDTKCAEIDRIIGKKEQLIEELGSYKKSLIYEYVTGKKEVLYQ